MNLFNKYDTKLSESLLKYKQETDRMEIIRSVCGGNLSKSSRAKLDIHLNKLCKISIEISMYKFIVKILNNELKSYEDVYHSIYSILGYDDASKLNDKLSYHDISKKAISLKVKNIKEFALIDGLLINQIKKF